ncbi:galactosyltransferase protein [Alkalilimnicola ehrlichii MLHE-1]|uniref:Galactosyltransferase protein n=1 Tax=Alkalilimnicola ehrlichii (strain ATCC BAA-1101 / DSM 17681 / MLHE-1) TaxID=187272 RepID=Q0ACF8_ALKEH|nr:galactosyltransferase protein [Alkalilimnicola ehrlichii MLHE-1]
MTIYYDHCRSFEGNNAPLLACVTPLIHPDVARSWPSVCARLRETAASVLSSDSPATPIRMFVGCNYEAEVSDLPSGVKLMRLPLPAPDASVYASTGDQEAVRLESVRLDKGEKVLAAAREARDEGAEYIMFLDADDLLSNRIIGWVAAHRGAPGWVIDKGWLHRPNSPFIYQQDRFNRVCGSCHIVRTDLIPGLSSKAEMTEDEIKKYFGSHLHLADRLSFEGHHLEKLPFRGAVYRVGHGNNISRRKRAIEFWALRRHPSLFLKRVVGFRRLSAKLIEEFSVPPISRH